MAQRVFLVQMPKRTLARAAGAIAGAADDRQRFAAELAESRRLHVRRVAVSQMVVHAIEEAGAELPEEFGRAANCMPFLLAADRAEGIVDALGALQKLHDESDLRDFFLEQARLLGITRTGALDEARFAAPTVSAMERWIRDQLDKAAELRRKALAAKPAGDDQDLVADYAISTWIWLARIFAQTHVAFWQGRNRWLGGAAFPEVFLEIETRAIGIGIEQEPRSVWGRIRSFFGGEKEPIDPELLPLIEASREHTRRQLASRSVQGLRDVLVSTATLTPALAVGRWEKSLPREGRGNLASGAVRHERLDDLVRVLRELAREVEPPYETTEEWIEIVVAAAMCAKNAEAHLVEGDDAIYGAYRWPIVDDADSGSD